MGAEPGLCHCPATIRNKTESGIKSKAADLVAPVYPHAVILRCGRRAPTGPAALRPTASAPLLPRSRAVRLRIGSKKMGTDAEAPAPEAGGRNDEPEAS